MASKLRISSSEACAIMYVDMVQCTQMTCRIDNSENLRLLYETFINTLSEIVISHGARVFKNGGDSIICYFPKSKDCVDKSAFREMLNCGLEMIRAREIINSELEAVGLPAISYRISLDYGKHQVVKDSNLDIVDIFGPTMCICAKINSLAPPNCMVIGSDLHEIVKSFSDFNILSYGEYKIQEKHSYPVFLVFKKV